MRTLGLEFYKVNADKIFLSNDFTHNDIAFILDGKAGYIWKGKKAKDLDELAAKKVESLIQKKFPETSFQLIPKADIYESDNPRIKDIKVELNKRLPNPLISQIKDKPKSIFEKVKEKYRSIKNYEDSWKWRSKLSNITNLWRLLVINVIVLIISILLMINKSIFYFQLNDFMLLIALISLGAIFVINLVYIIFPMKIQVLELYKEKKKSESLEDKAKLPPSPKLPKKKKRISKKKIQKIEIPELKPKSKKAKKKKTKEGIEYETEEDQDLGIPSIPNAPKKRLNIKIKDPNLSTEVIDKMKEMEDKKTEVVLVRCDKCESVIPVPVPKDAVLKSDLPIVPISYVHKNKDKEQHCITIFLDKDFDIRRRRFSDVIINN